MRFIHILIAAIAFLANPAHAFDVRTILESSGIINAGMNAHFDQSRTSPAQLYFDFLLPDDSDELMVIVQPGNAPSYMSIFLGQPEGSLVETVSFLNIPVPEVETEQRLGGLARAMQDTFFPMLTSRHSEASIMRISELTLRNDPAVELLGRYHEGGEAGRGLIYVRMLGILPPSGENTLLLYSLMNASILQPETAEDLANGFGGYIARSLQFVARRGDDGEMIPF